ncbi:YggT family protein [Candidatus Daviesbacteria bacterium]|nr:YggT family protein [Candidatus Daviesbacteria bacterium]
MEDQTREEITTVEKSSPGQVVRKISRVTPSPIQTEHPQKVFQKKKVIFRSYQIIWYILSIIEVLLIFRFLLKMIGANPFSGFTNLIYSLSNPLALPFIGVVSPMASGTSIFEWSTVIAGIVYLLLAYGIVQLFQFIKPITPDEVDKEVDSNA